MHATYKPGQCNIAGCGRREHALRLCKDHETEYLATNEARRLQEDVVALLERRASFGLRARAYLLRQLHYLSNVPVSYLEHFPLETIYLHHRRLLLLSQYVQGAERTEVCKRFKSLIRDFDHADNETLDDLKWRQSRCCDDPQYAYNRPLDFVDELRQVTLLAGGRYFKAVTLALVLYGCAIYLNKYLGTHIALPGSMSLIGAILCFIVAVGLVVGGSVFLANIGPMMAKAQAHELYANAKDNRDAVQIGLRIKGNFGRYLGLSYSQVGFNGLAALMICIPWSFPGDRTAFEGLASAALALCSWFAVFPALLIYSQYANASVALQALPQSRFQVDLHAADGRLGIAETVDLVSAGLLFNATWLAVLWIGGPVALRMLFPDQSVLAAGASMLVYQLAVYPIALFRVAQFRRLRKIRRCIIQSVEAAIADEGAKAKQGSIADKQARQQSIERARKFPVISTAMRGRIGWLVSTVAIPLAMMVADKVYSAMSMG